MTTAWLQSAILRTASILAPSDQRQEWLEEWRSELWYVPRQGATRFCLGAFRDAVWVRRNSLPTEKRPGTFLESPFSCLALLATLAAVSIMIAVRLERMLPFPPSSESSGLGGIAVIPLFEMPMAAVAFAIWNRSTASRARKLRGWIYLALKIAFVLPVILCATVTMIVFAPGATSVVLIAGGVRTFWWIFTDQRRRCPVCLRLLTEPVRIGTPSHTFLEWYGAESTCSRGHGLLHASETSISYWLTLDDSWSGLFSESSGRRQ